MATHSGSLKALPRGGFNLAEDEVGAVGACIWDRYSYNTAPDLETVLRACGGATVTSAVAPWSPGGSGGRGLYTAAAAAAGTSERVWWRRRRRRRRGGGWRSDSCEAAGGHFEIPTPSLCDGVGVGPE